MLFNLLKYFVKYKPLKLRRNFVNHMFMMENVTILDNPIKPGVDKKEYRVIQLSNGLKALLISDLAHLDSEKKRIRLNTNDSSLSSNLDDDSQATDGDLSDDVEMSDSEEDENETRYLSAASLCIGAGSFEDHGGVEGMMHFLEHMVFMGSDKYPKENCFDNFIRKNGGSDNAHTDYENTTYYFDVQEKHFEKALDIFANFFISPLMKVDAMQRERKSVHSEFQDSMNDDDCRRQQLISSMVSAEHPMSVFSWGNETTLQLTIPDSELHGELHRIKNRLYSSHYMTLAVQAREPLDRLQSMVLDIFSKVPNNNLPQPSYSHFGDPFVGKEKFNRLYKVVPVKDKHTLDINWALPSLKKYYRDKPLHYIAFLIGHEGYGSILSYFKKRVWAIDIYSGNDESGFEHNSTYALFNIRIRLTEEGFKRIKEVVAVIFQYLRMLEKEEPSSRIFSEIQNIEKIDFDYTEEKCTSDNVEEISEAMQRYPPQHYLTGSCLLYEYNPQLIKDCLSRLTPENCNIILSSKKFDSDSTNFLKEKWYGTKYLVEDIPDEWMKHWSNVEPIPELHLPSENPFIPDDFTVFESPTDTPRPSYPEKIIQDSSGELYFKQDFKFGLPRAYCYVYFFFDEIRSSPIKAAMIDLFINLFNQHIMEALYPACVAQYEIQLNAAEWGFTLKINGFSQKLKKCVEMILSQLDDFERCLENEAFEEMKKQQLKNYHNASLDTDILRRDTRLLLLQDVHWQVVEKMNALVSITKEYFLGEFLHKMLNNSFIKVLIQGNLTSDDSKAIYGCIAERFSMNSCHTCPQMKIRRCLGGEWVVRLKSLNETSSNSTVVNYYQGEALSLRNEILSEFVTMAMDEPVFDTLRTKDQLGYHVYCTNRNTFGVLGVSVTVNSHANKYNVSYINERIEAFLGAFVEHLSKLSEEDMAGLKETLASFKLNVDLTLKDEVDRNWGEIVSGDNFFDRFVKQLTIIPTITAKEAAAYLENLVSSKSEKYRKLSVQIVGSSQPENGVASSLEQILENNSKEILSYLGPSEDDLKSSLVPERFINDPRTLVHQMTFFQPTNKLDSSPVR